MANMINREHESCARLRGVRGHSLRIMPQAKANQKFGVSFAGMGGAHDILVDLMLLEHFV